MFTYYLQVSPYSISSSRSISLIDRPFESIHSPIPIVNESLGNRASGTHITSPSTSYVNIKRSLMSIIGLIRCVYHLHNKANCGPKPTQPEIRNSHICQNPPLSLLSFPSSPAWQSARALANVDSKRKPLNSG